MTPRPVSRAELGIGGWDHPAVPRASPAADLPRPEDAVIPIATGEGRLQSGAAAIAAAVPGSAEPGEVGPFQDIPRWIWVIFLGSWATFFGLLLAFFTTSRTATFMVVVSALFAVTAFGLPLILASQGRVTDVPSPTVVHTHTGELSVRAAAAQIALIPVAVVIGLAAFILLAL
jgi:hypothetical protein